MAIEKITQPYEILFRLDDSGNVKGCHMRSLEIIKDTATGEIYSEKELDPRPIAGKEMEQILGTINVSLVGSIHTLQDQVEQLNSSIQTKGAEIEKMDQLLVEASQRKVEMDTALQEKINLIATQEEVLVSKEAAIAGLNEEIKRKNSQLESSAQEANELRSAVQDKNLLLEQKDQQLQENEISIKAKDDEIVELKQRLAERIEGLKLKDSVNTAKIPRE